MGSDSWWILVVHVALHWVQRTAPTFVSRSSSHPTLLSALQKGQAKVVSSLGRAFLGGALAEDLRFPMAQAAAAAGLQAGSAGGGEAGAVGSGGGGQGSRGSGLAAFC